MNDKTMKAITVILAILIVICIVGLLAHNFGWLENGKQLLTSLFANPAKAPATAPDLTQVAGDVASHFTFLNFIEVKDGYLATYKYSGGYLPQHDPYAVEYDKKLNPTAYGIKIEGATPLERISNAVLRYALSPEELTHFRVQMAMPGTEILTSLDIENEYANWLRTQLTADQYDIVVNETLTFFYERFWSFETSTDWVLENILIDEVAGNHSNSRLKGRLSSDDSVKDALITCLDKSGKNFVSSKLGFDNTYRDAGATYSPTSQTAWIDLDEGGTWKWKMGAKITSVVNPPQSTSTPGPVITPPPTDPPGRTPHKDPSENPDDPIWSGPLTPGHDTDEYEPTEPARPPVVDPAPQQTQPEPQPPAAVVQPAEDCNGDGSTADEEASAVREDLQPAPAPVIDTVTDTHPAQEATVEVANQPEVPAVEGGFGVPGID